MKASNSLIGLIEITEKDGYEILDFLETEINQAKCPGSILNFIKLLRLMEYKPWIKIEELSFKKESL